MGQQLTEDLLAEIERCRAENAQLKRDAACFAALYEMAYLQSIYGCPESGREWMIAFPDNEGGDLIKDRERFRRAIEAQIPA
jgi:hypothetical protein